MRFIFSFLDHLASPPLVNVHEVNLIAFGLRFGNEMVCLFYFKEIITSFSIWQVRNHHYMLHDYL